MGWVTLSARKMLMTKKVSKLEHRLTYLSQAQQTNHSSQSYELRKLGVDKKDALEAITKELNANLDQHTNIFENSNADNTQFLQTNVAIQKAQLEYISKQNEINSVFTAKEQEIQQGTNCKQNILDLQQEEVETELQAARTELEQLKSAVSAGIRRVTSA